MTNPAPPPWRVQPFASLASTQDGRHRGGTIRRPWPTRHPGGHPNQRARQPRPVLGGPARQPEPLPPSLPRKTRSRPLGTGRRHRAARCARSLRTDSDAEMAERPAAERRKAWRHPHRRQPGPGRGAALARHRPGCQPGERARNPGRRTARLAPPAPKAADVARPILATLDRYREEPTATIAADWLDRAHPIGTELDVQTGAGRYQGAFGGLTPRGELILAGQAWPIASAEVFLQESKQSFFDKKDQKTCASSLVQQPLSVQERSDAAAA